eukprot:Blabericola_migrator_1__2898@NODE_1832_length_3721_cov_121_168309_g1174_i0_p2_GENE_NODE_1832_length_3721_cov_121_168309_g1174_i0NODE_1832_length_3721_cov_121_168309_g1174_i0_p2_ORF_typecomplete_len296_score37_14_NODE_1832_length_3721_cov_121_168309_g1174_i027913678
MNFLLTYFSLLIFRGEAVTEADLFVVNRVHCETARCKTTCYRYCSSSRTAADVSSCNLYLTLAQCNVVVDITESYNMTGDAICLMEGMEVQKTLAVSATQDTWYFGLPASAKFISVTSVEVRMTFRSVPNSLVVTGTSDKRVMFQIFKASLPSQNINTNTTTYTPMGVTTLVMSTTTSHQPPVTTTGTTLKSVLSALCNDDFDPTLTLLSSLRAEAFMNEISTIGSDLRGNLEKGHMLYAVRHTPNLQLSLAEQEDVLISVQISGERVIPPYSNADIRLSKPLLMLMVLYTLTEV